MTFDRLSVTTRAQYACEINIVNKPLSSRGCFSASVAHLFMTRWLYDLDLWPFNCESFPVWYTSWVQHYRQVKRPYEHLFDS